MKHQIFLMCLFLLLLTGCSARKGAYLHDPQNIEKYVCTKGFTMTHSGGTVLLKELHKQVSVGSEVVVARGGGECRVLMVNGVKLNERSKRTHYMYSLTREDWKNAGLVELPITEAVQKQYFRMCFPELQNARDSLKYIVMGILSVIALLVVAVKLYDYVGRVARYLLLLLMLPGLLLPIILPVVLYLYLDYNPIEAYWFIFDAFGNGWIGLLIWCFIVSQAIGTIWGAIDKIFLLITGVAHVIPTLITTAGAVAWAFWLHKAVTLFMHYHEDFFLMLIFFVGAGLAGSFSGKVTTDVLEDRYGNFVDSGSNMGNTFYGSGGRTYQRGTDGMFH